MAHNDEGSDRKDTRHHDSDPSDTDSGSSDRDVSRRAERKRSEKDDFTDIGTDAQQANGTAAGPSTS